MMHSVWVEHKDGRLEAYVTGLEVTCEVFRGKLAWEYRICDGFDIETAPLSHGWGMDKNHARDMAEGQLLALTKAGYRDS